jgi:hypothetical protein
MGLVGGASDRVGYPEMGPPSAHGIGTGLPVRAFALSGRALSPPAELFSIRFGGPAATWSGARQLANLEARGALPPVGDLGLRSGAIASRSLK